MRITVARLIAAGVEPTQAKRFADPLSAACALFEIDTPARVAAFVAQACHESAAFTRMEELLFYRSPERILKVFKRLWPLGLQGAMRLVGNPKDLACVAYAGVNGNGTMESGDGWTYRGRGLFQLTGLSNYTAAARALGRPYVESPSLVAEPSDACLTAAWYWHAMGLNTLADSWQIGAITRLINGPAMLKAGERLQMSEEAARAFA